MYGDIFTIDLHRETVMGWQSIILGPSQQEVPFVDQRVLDGMLESIANDHEFYPVNVAIHRRDPFEWRLAFCYDWRTECLDGGHHRAAAHYWTETPLRCVQVEGVDEMLVQPWPGFYPIEDLQVLPGDLLEGLGYGISERRERWRKLRQ